MLQEFVSDFKEIRQQLLQQADTTRDLWQDKVAQRYYEQFVDKALKDVEEYLDGGSGFVGKGLIELSDFITEKYNEFNSL